MRRTWVLVICIVLAIGSMSIGIHSENAEGEIQVQRNVLFELFTATWCVGCPYADAAADQLKAEYGERVSVLQYHVQEQQVSDIYFDTPEINARASAYGAPPLPRLWVDGVESREGASSTSESYSSYKLVLESRLTANSPLDLKITSSNLTAGTIAVTVELTATDSLQQSSFNLRFVAYENRLTDNISIFNYVVRDIGVQSVSASSLPTTLSQNLEYNETWNYSNMGVVVFAQIGDTDEVLQSHSMSFGVEDADGDGLPDEWEMLKLGTLLYSGEDDPDGDGITNLEEYQNRTDPLVKDSSGGIDAFIYVLVAAAAVAILLVTFFVSLRMRGRTGKMENEAGETGEDEEEQGIEGE